MRKLFTLLFAAVMMVTLANAQEDYPTSVGPAPQSNQKVNQESQSNQVGSRYFVQISSSPTFQIGRAFLETCNVTNIGAPFTITFPGGLMRRNGILYTYNQSSPFQLWSIDTNTGVHTLVFNMTGVPQANFTGMCWDGTNVYGITTTLASSQIFTVNMSTGVCTPIGAASPTCAGAITLLGRLGAQSSLWVLDIVADNLYRCNKTTGVFTLVGPLGVNINFGQDGSVDPNDNTLYVCCYSTGPELRKFDTATGGLGPVLCTYTAQATGMAIVANGPPPGIVTTICRNGINIPVPDGLAAGVRDTIKMIGNTSCPIQDINVRIDTFLHTWDSDMTFTLTHNGASSVSLIANRGGSGDNFIGTILNDSAANPISGGTAPFTGQFRPEAPLILYSGQNAAGSWELQMVDNAGGDLGFMHAWCIVFQYLCPTGGITTVEVPFTYRLSQNYPNPFNPVTTIKYGLPKYGNTKLVVYDITGRVVKTLVNEFKDAGTYEVTFDASNFASGVYFYTLESGTYKETKKMLLVK
jgi:subtilisin-like proprotein convertase family protein